MVDSAAGRTIDQLVEVLQRNRLMHTEAEARAFDKDSGLDEDDAEEVSGA
jgi:hypothetical protein